MKVIAIARNTFREALRDKALYVLVVFSVVLVGATRVISPLALGEGVKITKDVGLSAISFFGMLAIIVMGAGLVHKEIDRKTIFMILSKPVSRRQFILGKFLGMADALVVMVVVMLLALQLVLLTSRVGLDVLVLKAGLLTFVELLVMTSIAILFSSFSTTALSASLTFIIYGVGHFSGDLLKFADRLPSEFARYVCHLLYYVLPDLEVFNVRGMAVHGSDISTERLLAATSYGVLYVLGALMFSVLIFSRRDFK
ncbi:MAG: ABC transporter permease subunit [Candidatus Eiseniibacteriota bacterium]|nr:MAG: ABC transporter permease subunit [Candidatus Eisenbacteria bacterium]